MRSFIALAAFFVVVSGGLVLTHEGPKWIPAMADLVPGRANDDDRVLVFLVPGPEGVDRQFVLALIESCVDREKIISLT